MPRMDGSSDTMVSVIVWVARRAFPVVVVVDLLLNPGAKLLFLVLAGHPC